MVAVGFEDSLLSQKVLPTTVTYTNRTVGMREALMKSASQQIETRGLPGVPKTVNTRGTKDHNKERKMVIGTLKNNGIEHVQGPISTREETALGGKSRMFVFS